MKDTVTHFISALVSGSNQKWYRSLFNPIADRYSTLNTTSAALVIKAGGSALVKAGAAFNGFVKGRMYSKAINTDMAALVGTVVNATFNVWVFYIDGAGTLTSALGNAGATLGAVTLPEPPEGVAMIGLVIINPTGTGNFVGGTTALDDATVVPNAAYMNFTCGFDATVLI